MADDADLERESRHPYRIIREAGSHRLIVETDDLDFAREVAEKGSDDD